MAYSRKCKRYFLEGGNLIRLLRTGGLLGLPYIPIDSKIAGLTLDSERPNTICLFIESSEFEPVEEGQPVPIGGVI